MKVDNLSKVSFGEIIDCFLKAFENYYVKMPTDQEYYRQRWKAAKVDFNLSYGMFDDEKLVGFIIHAVDKRLGLQTAFNTATGVIPAYRGKRIVQSIYDFALRDLRKNGIEKSVLEVITDNERAVRAYQKVGFKICKDYRCYSGKINSNSDSTIEMQKITMEEYHWDQLPNQQFYSWDFQKETILEGHYTLYEVIWEGKSESYFAIDIKKKYLGQFDVFSQDQKAWERLFNAIGKVVDEVKIINVDHRLEDKLNYISFLKLNNIVNQFEMELMLID
ncbi:GNAT family N-acetyltransferase [Flammeovirga sp. SJP92]|uniref:GNAT family N-acetyltransferase n=1 Tax=Flammeovirga sp. SJP92 TaxID=1775430 RepID=UPI00078691F9|nr:GNAT family N-acetyltransferase [Flammeovirga sp. SJP92]KXX66627.1 GNAT family acetyltransferase [Flammeovirga sp. SJP92]